MWTAWQANWDSGLAFYLPTLVVHMMNSSPHGIYVLAGVSSSSSL